mmetsp:Transcript_29227/g.68836  ORF Transcript_29227/g.68836 Transcript_29227/m.68836 type:complete len:240 (-) Transcript_29227:89-808(-)
MRANCVLKHRLQAMCVVFCTCPNLLRRREPSLREHLGADPLVPCFTFVEGFRSLPECQGEQTPSGCSNDNIKQVRHLSRSRRQENSPQSLYEDETAHSPAVHGQYTNAIPSTLSLSLSTDQSEYTPCQRRHRWSPTCRSGVCAWRSSQCIETLLCRLGYAVSYILHILDLALSPFSLVAFGDCSSFQRLHIPSHHQNTQHTRLHRLSVPAVLLVTAYHRHCRHTVRLSHHFFHRSGSLE